MLVEGSLNFVKAVQNVFETMLQTSVENGTQSGSEPEGMANDVSVVISFSGDIQGICFLCLPEESARKIVEKFVGEDLPTSHPDFSDAIGELLNMIAGNAKAKFKDLDTSISCPTVIVGSHMHISQKKDHVQSYIPYQCELGTFVLGLSYEVDDNKMAA